MKTLTIKDGLIYQLLMRVASKMKDSELIGLKASSEECEIIVTIKTKEKTNDT